MGRVKVQSNLSSLLSGWLILIVLLLICSCWCLLSTIFSCRLSLSSWSIRLASLLLLTACCSVCLSIGLCGSFLLSRGRLLVYLGCISSWLARFDLLSIDVLLSTSVHVAIFGRGHLVVGRDLHRGLLITLHTTILLVQLLTHAIHVLLLIATDILALVRILLLISIHIHVHSIVIDLALDRCKCSRRSSHSQLLVLLLCEGELLTTSGDSHVHKLHLLALLVLEVLIVSASWNATLSSLEYFNLLAVLVLLFSHLVDALDQVDVVLHETRVVLTMLLEISGQLQAIVTDVSLMRLSFTSMLSVGIDILSLSVSFLQNPSLIETHDTFLELLIVSNVLDNLKDIILETLLLEQLHVKLMTTV